MEFVIKHADLKDKSPKKQKSPKKPFDLLEVFLNYHVIGNFHGWSYQFLQVTLYEHAPAGKNSSSNDVIIRGEKSI